MSYQITVERVFCASHQLLLIDGTLETLHGHNWTVRVTVAADQLDAMDCVMDFHQLLVDLDTVLAPWHNHHLNDREPFKQQKINPSAERIAQIIGQSLPLPENVRLVKVDLTEAPGCQATWLP
jgi:6-pyruvoyltetrahydropterin/6-carboxytetrahydropterin synthase